MALSISVTVAGLSMLYGDELRGVVETAKQAEDAGIDQLALPDHVTIGPNTDRYPYGRFPLPQTEPWLEPLTTLAAIAGATERIRLATGILIAPLRPAALLAKTLATLDVLSQGRLDLGVGTGWQSEEYEAVGVPFHGRSDRLDDTLRACRALWSEAPAKFASDTVRFEQTWSLPQPAQKGGIPLWLGLAPSPRNLARFVEFDAGWMPMTSDPGELADGVQLLRGARTDAGLNPEGLRVRANAPVATDASGRADLAATLDGLDAFAACGVTHAAFALPRFVRSADEIPAFLTALGRRDG